MISIAECKDKLDKLLRKLQEWSWFNVGLFLLNKFLTSITKGRCCLYRYYFVAQPVTKARLVPRGKGRKIEIRLIQEQDEIALQFPRPAPVIESRFRQGAKCLVAMKEQRFIGFLWVQPGHCPYQEDEVRARYIPLPADRTAWDFDVYVVPEFRLGRTFPRLWEEANHFLGEHGVAWSCSRISAYNTGSLSAHAHLGTMPLGSAIFFCAGWLQITFATIPPYFHLSSQKDSFPKFRLDVRPLRAISDTA